MTKPITTSAWQQYEDGKAYKHRIRLYETVRRNERFYRGDQWHGSQSELPRPVFNLVRRITDYLANSVLPGDVSIRYSDARLPFLENESIRRATEEALHRMEQNALYRWKQNGMAALSRQALIDAAISGDGVFYCWWDASVGSGQPFEGEIRTDLVDNTNLFVADVNLADLQSQEYVLLAGRASVGALRREALEAGHSERDVARIRGDAETDTQAGDLGAFELREGEKATYLIRFFREDGEVVFEKSTRELVIRRVKTGLHLYPVAYFNWHKTKNAFHGNAPVGDMIANQRYINSAYAMMMKHMHDTAFSKIVYDKSRIPEWSNEVGEAIAAQGGGSVSDAVSVVGVGRMQEGYLELIDRVIDNTKSMMSATEAALGDAAANNTSAILILQQASKIALRQVSANLRRCLGELVAIWADMLCAYSPAERLLPVMEGDGLRAVPMDYALLRHTLLSANVEIGETDAYTPSATVTLLDKLLERGDIDVCQYLELLPPGILTAREAVLDKIRSKGEGTDA